MDASKLVLVEPVGQPSPLQNLDGIKGIGEDRKKELAKDFESVLLSKLFDQMKNTVGNWGLEKDAATKQTEGIFWMYMARDVAKNGGMGMWKDIHKFLTDLEANKAAASSGEKANGKSILL